MVERSSVYHAIDTERDYQDKRWQYRFHTETEFLLYMEHYIQEARKLASTKDLTYASNKKLVLEQLRKVVALGVSCMEQHGAPVRRETSL